MAPFVRSMTRIEEAAEGAFPSNTVESQDSKEKRQEKLETSLKTCIAALHEELSAYSAKFKEVEISVFVEVWKKLKTTKDEFLNVRQEYYRNDAAKTIQAIKGHVDTFPKIDNTEVETLKSYVNAVTQATNLVSLEETASAIRTSVAADCDAFAVPQDVLLYEIKDT